jgi:hypothetical protein
MFSGMAWANVIKVVKVIKGRKLRILVVSWSVCSWQAFPA